MKKRGLSNVITVVLIIVLMLAASVIIWGVTQMLISDSGEDFTDQVALTSVRLSIVEGSLVINENLDVSFIVERLSGGDELDGFIVVLSSSDGQSFTYTEHNDEPIEIFDRVSVNILGSEHGLPDVIGIEVYGILSKPDGGNVTSNSPLTQINLQDISLTGSSGGSGGDNGGGDNGGGDNNPPPTPTECGNGLCEFGEALSCSLDCVNLLSNPGFDDGSSSWPGSPGSPTTDNGENVLEVSDGSVSQTVDVQGNDAFHFSYRVKPISVTGNQNVVALPYYLYSGGGQDGLFYNWLRVGITDEGEWQYREHYIETGKDLSQIRIQLFAQNGDRALYDDVSLVAMDTSLDTSYSNDKGEMLLGSYGMLKSLTVDGEEQINITEPISNIKYSDGTTYPASRIEPIGNNKFRIGYYDIPTTTTISVSSGNHHYAFELESVNNPVAEIEDIEVVRFRPRYIPQIPSALGAASAIASPVTTPFLNAVPTKPDTLCELLTSHYTCRHSRYEFLGWEDGGWAILATTKEDYFDGLEEIAAETPAPYVLMDDGVWLKKSQRVLDSYFFPAITLDDYQETLQLTQLGNFEDILIHGVYEGTYNVPYHHSLSTPWDPANNYEQFYETVMGEFRDAGIDIGIHTFLNQVVAQGGLVDFTNPNNPDTEAYSGDLKDVFYSFELGTTTEAISDTQRYITLDSNIEDHPVFAYYALGVGRPANVGKEPFHSNNYLIGNELVRCLSYVINPDDTTTFDCVSRGTSQTTKDSYPSGEPFYYAPPQIGFFINPDNSEAKQDSIDGLHEMMARLDVDYLYVDGYSDLPLPGMDETELISVAHKLGVIEYIENAPGGAPHIQLGGSPRNLAWSFTARSASDDAGVFRNKEFTKKHKLEGIISRSNPYGNTIVGLDWWKVHGAAFDGFMDQDAVSFDDVDYVMGKSVGLNLPIGVQTGAEFKSHEQLQEIFAHMGLYNQLRNEIRAGQTTLPESIRSYLSDYDNEAELTDVAGWNFIRKDEFREYASWSSGSDFVMSGNNQFGPQPIYLEIRPRFDYKGFGDSGNILVSDFSEVSNTQVSSEGGASCSISNGVLTYSGGSQIGACTIRIPGSLTIDDRRGIGLRLNGDGRDTLLVASYVQNGFSRRDFTEIIDFNGERTLILGNPDGDYQDEVDGQVVSSGPLGKPRHWEIYTDSLLTFEIQIRNILPGASSSSITFHELKALQEKSGGIVNPEVTIGSETITFPVTLSIDDSSPYLLTYDGSTYTLYNSNYGEISSGGLASSNIASGPFTVSLNSDTSNSDSLTKAEIIVRTFDDEDRDGIPTDGSFGAGIVCTGSNNFCDDPSP